MEPAGSGGASAATICVQSETRKKLSVTGRSDFFHDIIKMNGKLPILNNLNTRWRINKDILGKYAKCKGAELKFLDRDDVTEM
jgi:hypothetical protein